MSTTWTPEQASAAPRCAPCGEHECTSGTRNRYYPGKRLTPDTMSAEQDYLVERRRMINRAMHGWGVVYGYATAMATDSQCGDAAPGTLRIGPGLAFDRMGRELVQTTSLDLLFGDMIDIPGGSGDCWLLRVHYAEELSGPVSVSDPCHCERQQWDRVCETVRYSLERVPCSQCCEPQACGLACGCAEGPCCAGQVPIPPKGMTGAQGVAAGARAGALCCMCEHLTGLAPGGSPKWHKVGPRLRVDMGNGVPLACLRLNYDEKCKTWSIDDVADACGPRRLVKRNDLLYDLVRGCDLTRISAISWAAWHRAPGRVAWAAFESFFGTAVSAKNECMTKFNVSFSRPVRKDTVGPDCFSMTFLFNDAEGAWKTSLRAPILRIEHIAAAGHPTELVSGAALVVGWKWVNDAIRGTATRFDRCHALVEIEIHGDFILDCNGQALDANAQGLQAAPTGNGAPGGTFRSTFWLARKPTEADPDDDEACPPTDIGGTLS